ncbi:hypothetical protein BAE44_0006056 [Dichanthelium oligosanthes]|uniref:DUF547 domain-containing protein n=1 Tax=Dichanthelium oligosanthes TaxID=888268 RepID=A0A1E5W6D2_9POAL|nr:hypothetical protein BAE44_0006056 [Dichanthelium oligosanthes]
MAPPAGTGGGGRGGGWDVGSSTGGGGWWRRKRRLGCWLAAPVEAGTGGGAGGWDGRRSSGCRGGSIQRAVRRMASGGGRRSGGSASASVSASCSGDDTSIGSGKKEGGRRCSMQRYRSQLEQEVKKLQKELQEEIDLHLALADAITYNAALILNSSIKLPEKMQQVFSMEKEIKENQKIDALPFNQYDVKKSSLSANVWNNPNQLSEEMVRSMKDIFLHLSASSKISPEAPFANSSSSAEHLSSSTLTSLSGSSVIASVLRSPSVDLNHDDGISDEVRNFDPYNVNGKEARRDIGSYCSVTEVSWMYIGTEQLEYASGALKRFRFLVEQLSKVDPSSMNCDERLAFWINLYNALIMHAYLAYGVPENDIKLFSLMQKSLMLALHKFKTSEKIKKCSIEDTEPLVLFALCCGMFSSPAVRILSAANIRQELQESMRDYIRASVGINDKGELVVPKLLQSYAKGIVEDSLLADWICRHLTLDQVAAIQNTSSSHKQRLLGVRSFSVIPFDSRFRYLFLSNTRCRN